MLRSYVVVVVADAPVRGARGLVFQANSMQEARRKAVVKAAAAQPLRWRVKSAERLPV